MSHAQNPCLGSRTLGGGSSRPAAPGTSEVGGEDAPRFGKETYQRTPRDANLAARLQRRPNVTRLSNRHAPEIAPGCPEQLTILGAFGAKRGPRNDLAPADRGGQCLGKAEKAARKMLAVCPPQLYYACTGAVIGLALARVETSPSETKRCLTEGHGFGHPRFRSPISR